MKRVWATVIAVGAGVALLGGTSAVQAARKTTTKEQRAQVRQQRQQGKKPARVGRGVPKGENVVGTIQYDPGGPPDSVVSEPGGDNIFANHFNTALGAPLRAGNLTAVTFFPGNVANPAIISVLGPPNGTTATQILSIAISGVVGNTFNTANVAPVGVGPAFMVGQYVGAFGGTDQAALRAASYAGQGFHAMQMNFNSASITGVVALPGQNCMFRTTGDVLTPVELMNFRIE